MESFLLKLDNYLQSRLKQASTQRTIRFVVMSTIQHELNTMAENLEQQTQSIVGVSVKSDTLSEDRQSSLGMPGSESLGSIFRCTNKYIPKGGFQVRKNIQTYVKCQKHVLHICMRLSNKHYQQFLLLLYIYTYMHSL